MVRAWMCNVIDAPSMRRKLAKETWALFLIRLAYVVAECAKNIEWLGPGRFAAARKCTTKFSLVLFKLFKGLSARNRQKQTDYLNESSWASFPVPLREWLTTRYGHSTQSSFSDSSQDPDLETWRNITEKVSAGAEEPSKIKGAPKMSEGVDAVPTVNEATAKDFAKQRLAAGAAAAATKKRRGIGSGHPLDVVWDLEEISASPAVLRDFGVPDKGRG